MSDVTINPAPAIAADLGTDTLQEISHANSPGSDSSAMTGNGLRRIPDRHVSDCNVL